ncbi:hypothetical protein PTKIN_Ptkin03bG0101100 [Pterospermum kingtungense]
MIETFRVVWRLAKQFDVLMLDSNIFLFKFESKKDKNRALDAASWTFERVYGLPLNLISTNIVKSLGMKIRRLIEVDTNPYRFGWVRNIRMRVEIDIIKPLRCFVTVVKGYENDDIWGRLGYERLPFFCNGCGRIGHGEFESEYTKNGDSVQVKKYSE